ncbi:hypothetical protein KP509_07G064900 [Ceratopteris richardii]|uniref:Phototropic-responsive NPH3 family protein n=1 Tax=Ceratopteris richardii TaxID=49495 RepID=A0A8T2UBN9_CERRI|nr:hypothetical protein KP509_07G064900 [Ceratopteris richardii]KAH7433355.1 hypothetical protein KP509_07G064900 [Ceratopteris richardii]KAH7433357.1 hypothetical protein KP509_07G064900 [Ceratopteris richardii]
MACLKLGFKPDGLQRSGQAWFFTSGLPSDVIIEVDGMLFHLHKFPLVFRSGKLACLLREHLEKNSDIHKLKLTGIPGGPDCFELAVKFCYGIRLELTGKNVVPLRCAAEYLEMTDDFGGENLISYTEAFLEEVVLRNLKECMQALCSCENLTEAEELGIVDICINAVVSMACQDSSLLSSPVPNKSMHSPGGSLLWNGIETGARPKKQSLDWWHEDVSMLKLPLFRRVILTTEKRGLKPEIIAGVLLCFAQRYLPGLNKRHGSREGSNSKSELLTSTSVPEDERRVILETIENLLPVRRAGVPTKFLSGLLRSSILLDASPHCRSNIERRIGLQLEQASLDDILIPNLTHNLETLYDIDCVQRILDHFLDQSTRQLSPQGSDVDGNMSHQSPSSTPMISVSKLLDRYIVEVAPDVNLKLPKFYSLIEALPDFARTSDDGLYHAIDIYLKAHPWLKEDERDQLCRLMDFQKLSPEACTHAAQNERLPLRTIIQVLFFEQLQIRTDIASCFLVSDHSYHLPHSSAHGALTSEFIPREDFAGTIRNNNALKVDIDRMKSRVNDLERECSGMRNELQKLGNVRDQGQGAPKFIGGRFRSYICRTNDGELRSQTHAKNRRSNAVLHLNTSTVHNSSQDNTS